MTDMIKRLYAANKELLAALEQFDVKLNNGALDSTSEAYLKDIISKTKKLISTLAGDESKSIDDVPPEEWDAAFDESSAKREKISQLLTSAAALADNLGREVYIVDVNGALQLRTADRYRAEALEVVHPSESTNAKKSS